MTDLPRLKPDPIPSPHPVPELLAEGELKARYEDMKAVLRVPWMGVVTMSFAYYRPFYDALWAGTRALCGTREFTEACRHLRRAVEAKVGLLAPPPARERLSQIGYAAREIEAIDEVIEIFSYGNFPYLLLATLARLLLEGGELRASDTTGTPAKRPSTSIAGRLVLMEYHHADAATRAVFDDVKAALGLPFLNTDYRALARWPSYFSLAWRDLRPKLSTGDYAALVNEIHAAAVAGVRDLPNFASLCGETLRAAARSSAAEGEVLAIVRLFQWLLPGLVTNVAFFRAQLR